MSKQCDKCGKFISSDATHCLGCFVKLKWPEENPWQDVPEPTTKREYPMGQEVKAGQTWGGDRAGKSYEFVVIGRSRKHPGVWVIEWQKTDIVSTWPDDAFAKDTLLKDEHGREVALLVNRSEGQTVSGGLSDTPIEAPAAAQQEVEVGQTRKTKEGSVYDIIGRSRRGLHGWVIEWHNHEVGKRGNIAARYDKLIEEEQAPKVAVECQECGGGFFPPAESPLAKYCPFCADNLTTCRYCGKDYEKTEGACGRCHNVKVRCIICGKDFEGPPAACGDCYGQLKLRVDEAEGKMVGLKINADEFLRRLTLYRKALGDLGYRGNNRTDCDLEKALTEFVSCFPGYSIGADMGKGPDKTVVQVVRAPGELETEVVVSDDGDIEMHLVTSRGAQSAGTGNAFQGRGSYGWTCVGFRFMHHSTVTYPFVHGWAALNPNNVNVANIGEGRYPKSIVAIKAVWRKLGA